MTGKRTNDDPALEAMFDAAARHAPAPEPAFLARLHADAEQAMPVPAKTAAAPAPQNRRLVERLQGYFALSGLTGAAAIGVWIGFVAPDLLTATTDFTSDDPLSLSVFLPGADLSLLTE